MLEGLFTLRPQIRPPVQRATASPSTRSTSELQTGQCVGNSTGRVSSGRSESTTFTTCGMTSPARRITTLSPMRNPRRSISSALCSVALLTSTPATCTGSRRATGVIAPVRPTELHVTNKGHLLLRREFKSHRPARRTRDEAQLLLKRHRVDLNHYAVNVKAQRRTVLFHLMVKRQHGFRGVAQSYAIADRQPPRFELEHGPDGYRVVHHLPAHQRHSKRK